MSAITDIDEIKKKIISEHSEEKMNVCLEEFRKQTPDFADNEHILLKMVAAKLEVSLMIEDLPSKPLKIADIMKMKQDGTVNLNAYFWKYIEKEGRAYLIVRDDTGEAWITQWEANTASPLKKFKLMDPITCKDLVVKVKDRVYINIYKNTFFDSHAHVDGDGYICSVDSVIENIETMKIKDIQDIFYPPVDYPTIKGTLDGPVIIDGTYNACPGCLRSSKVEYGQVSCNYCDIIAAPVKLPSRHVIVSDGTAELKVLVPREFTDGELAKWNKGTVVIGSGYYNKEKNRLHSSWIIKVADPGHQFMPEKKEEIEVKEVTVPVAVPESSGLHPLITKIHELMKTERGWIIRDIAAELDKDESMVATAMSYLFEKGIIVEPVAGYFQVKKDD